MPRKSRTPPIVPRLRGPRWTPETARAVLAAQKESGESMSAFGRRHGIGPQRLYWWRGRLAEWERVAPSPRLLVPVVTTAPSAPVGSAQLRLRYGEVELELRDAAAVPPTWLAEVMRALGGGR